MPLPPKHGGESPTRNDTPKAKSTHRDLLAWTLVAAIAAIAADPAHARAATFPQEGTDGDAATTDADVDLPTGADRTGAPATRATTGHVGDAADPEPPPDRWKSAPDQKEATFAVTIAVPDGDPEHAWGPLAGATRLACRARFPEYADRCHAMDARKAADEFHVLSSQPLVLAAYVNERAMAKASGIPYERPQAEPDFRFPTCGDDPRFEDGERIGATVVAKSGGPCPAERTAYGPRSTMDKLRAVRAVVTAERTDGEPADPADVDPQLSAAARVPEVAPPSVRSAATDGERPPTGRRRHPVGGKQRGSGFRPRSMEEADGVPDDAPDR